MNLNPVDYKKNKHYGRTHFCTICRYDTLPIPNTEQCSGCGVIYAMYDGEDYED